MRLELYQRTIHHFYTLFYKLIYQYNEAIEDAFLNLLVDLYYKGVLCLIQNSWSTKNNQHNMQTVRSKLNYQPMTFFAGCGTSTTIENNRLKEDIGTSQVWFTILRFGSIK